jgi:hypothetical protein
MNRRAAPRSPGRLGMRGVPGIDTVILNAVKDLHLRQSEAQ